MLTGPVSAKDTHLVIDRTTHCIRFERTLSASRAEAFEAWTDPEQVACWWDGQPLHLCEIDLKPGGTFTFVSKGRPDMPFSGTYLEITPPERLIFEALGATGRVLLDEIGGKTRLIVEIQCRSEDHLEEFLKVGVDQGTAVTLDNLVAYLDARMR